MKHAFWLTIVFITAYIIGGAFSTVKIEKEPTSTPKTSVRVAWNALVEIREIEYGGVTYLYIKDGIGVAFIPKVQMEKE